MIQDLQEISDGKIYGTNDMAKVACADCAGCHACCEDMGNSIVLDPYDMYRLACGLSKSAEELLSGELELQVQENVILPNIRMKERDGGVSVCPFLNEEGRCRIHTFRPGLCRVFPLGRIYEENGVSYFLQKDACKKRTGSKMKVSRWLDTPELKRYHKFLSDWHNLRKKLEQIAGGDETTAKQVNLLCLKLFYLKPYEKDVDFYAQFETRLAQMTDLLV